MSNSTLQDPSWNEFETLRHSIKTNTVDKLKQIISGLTEECGANLSKSGKKQDLIDRITQLFENYRVTAQTDRWNRARAVMYQVRNTGSYTPATTTGVAGSSANIIGHSLHGPATSPKVLSHGYHPSNGAGSSTIGRYDPLAPARRAVPPTSVTPGVNTNIRFKASPFFKVDQAVSTVVECPESSGAMDRRNQTLFFTLTQEQLGKLSQPSPKYQLRLYCTSSTFYMPSSVGFRSVGLCPVEFPATCEVRVNNVQLLANLKGVKKKPGTAPPADLGKSVRSIAGVQNRVEMVYVNSQQPVVPKKFYLVVFLVEVTNVDQLVERLKKGKHRSIAEVKFQMVKVSSEDDDIIAGKQTMSLKCPLSYMRISNPCRSDKCLHSQCFDAMSWFSVMEQTTTWLCPVCEKVLSSEDLIIDGYFDDILRQTPDSVEEVIVEPDGEWHTTDKKYGSVAWKAAHAGKSAVKQELPRTAVASGSGSRPQSQSSLSKSTVNVSGASANGKVGHSSGEIVILDSDDEDEGRVKRELSPSFASSRINSNVMNANSSSSHDNARNRRTLSVIDLTLDSDTEEPLPPPRKVEKRKADEAYLSQGSQSPKRPRGDIVPSTTRRTANGYVNGQSSSTSSPASVYSPRPPAPLSPPRASSSSYPPPPSSTSTAHHAIPQPSSYASGRYPYGSYSAPHLPSRPGSAYEPAPVNDPRQHHYPQQSYGSNPYLPRINGSGPAGWP